MKKMQLFKTNYLLFALAVLMTCSCAKNPVTGKRQLSLMSTKQEIALGQQSDPAIVSSYGVYEDDKIQRFISQKGRQMAAISHRKKLDYDFKILDSPVVNAFAVPGGFVYFTRGIMAHFNNEAEFAGVLGHEIGHITARHSASQYSKQQLAQVGFIVGVIASPTFRQFANEAQTGMSLLFLKFGRDDESQSDKLGVEYSTKIGYDAKYMANFFKTLARMRDQAGDAGQIPTFLSTHPDPADRYQKVKEMATKAQAKTNRKDFKVNRDAYLRMIDGLVYGEDPKQGYVENDNFYHPELKFQFELPRGWQTANSPSQFQASEPNGKAAVLLQLAPEKTLQEAANAFVTNNELQSQGSRNVQVNGLPGIAVVADQQNPNDPNATLRILTYFIQYNNMIYKLHGLALATDFQRYESNFLNTMESFKELRDASKLNVKPERIKIITVAKTGTLQSVFQANNVPSDRHEELSILNSMLLSEQVEKGMLIKIVNK
ncbi:MAG: M48 family metalloprotease [Saprospiraceae bacterium]